MATRASAAILGALAAAVLAGVLCVLVFHRHLSSWRVRHAYTAYASFLEIGSARPADAVFAGLILDPDRNAMVRGRDTAEILRLYPFLTPASAFPKGTCKHGSAPTTGAVYWFSPDDGFDWCVVIAPNPADNRVLLIKG